MTSLWIVIPCYNEEKVLPVTAPIFFEKLKSFIDQEKISKDSRILFVNDGSTDKTWEIIKTLSLQEESYIGISLSRNRGHQNAVLAGLMEAKDQCDITITIDCDGQDDIKAMDEMVDQFHNGYEIVYGVRNDRKTDSFFKRNTAQFFYKMMNLLGAEVIYNHADYRLISSKVLKELAGFREVNIFLRGMIPLVGFQHTVVYYERKERIAGKSHYPLGKMVSLALNGITSLSIKPIRLITGFGFLVSVFSFAAIIWAIVNVILGNTVPGWASSICIQCFMGGIQLLSLGVIGEYVGKIYLETKARPRYIISQRTYKKVCEK